MNKRIAIFLGLSASLVMMAACETAPVEEVPQTSWRVVRADPPPPPAHSAVYVEPPRTVRRTNEFGGEIPQAAPSSTVDEGGLGDIR